MKLKNLLFVLLLGFVCLKEMVRIPITIDNKQYYVYVTTVPMDLYSSYVSSENALTIWQQPEIIYKNNFLEPMKTKLK